MIGDGFSNNSSIILTTSGETKSMRQKLQEIKDLNYISKVDTMLLAFEKECELAIKKGRDVVYFTVVMPEDNATYMSKDVLNEFGYRLKYEGFTFKCKMVDETKYLYEVNLNLKR